MAKKLYIDLKKTIRYISFSQNKISPKWSWLNFSLTITLTFKSVSLRFMSHHFWRVFEFSSIEQKAHNKYFLTCENLVKISLID